MFYQKDLKKRCGDGERVDVRIRNSLLVSGLIGRRIRGVRSCCHTVRWYIDVGMVSYSLLSTDNANALRGEKTL